MITLKHERNWRQTEDQKHSITDGLEELNCENHLYDQKQIQFNPHQNPSAFPYGNKKKKLKIHREEQESLLAK